MLCSAALVAPRVSRVPNVSVRIVDTDAESTHFESIESPSPATADALLVEDSGQDLPLDKIGVQLVLPSIQLEAEVCLRSWSFSYMAWRLNCILY